MTILKSKNNKMNCIALYTVWHFPYWGREKGSHIGVDVRAQRTPSDPGSGFQSLPDTCIKNMYGTFSIGVGGRGVTLV